MSLPMKMLSVLFLALCLAWSECPLEAAPGQHRGQPIIFDTDIGNSTDDLFALDLLYKMMDSGIVDLKGIIVERTGAGYADLADIENTYYGYPRIPIGIDRHGIANSRIFIDYRMLDELKNPDGSKMFKRTDTNLNDNIEGYKLYRKILAEAKDSSVKIVAVGFVSSIVQLLESAPDEYSELPGRELVRQKVDSLYFMGTKLGGSDNPGYNLGGDLPLARRFLNEWPSQVMVYLSPSPVGDAIEYLPEEVLSDMEAIAVHPIKQTNMHKDCNTGQKMWDSLCVINAVYPQMFSYSGHGFVSLTEDDKIMFTEHPRGNFIYQLPGDKDWNAKQLALLKSYLKSSQEKH